MRYSYLSDFKLYKLACRTYIRSSPRVRFWFHFQMWGMVVLGLILGVISLFLGKAAAMAMLPICGGLIAGGIVFPVLRPWNLRRAYKAWSGEYAGRSVYIEVDGTQLRSGIDGKSEGRFERAAICGVAEDSDVLLLFINKKKFLYLPKSVLPDQAIDEVRQWLALPGAPSSC